MLEEPELSLHEEIVAQLPSIFARLDKDKKKATRQIFITTHNDFLPRYLDVRKTKTHNVCYYTLYKDESGRVIHEFNNDYEMLDNNIIITQSVDLYKEEVDKVML